MKTHRPIRLIGVKQNNLKNISLEIPARKWSVITGPSGSGKSSLAFDTLYAEGQRRFVESLSTYTRQFLEKMPKPEIEAIENIPPAIALEQHKRVLNSRSTVGSDTEILDYLRILFSKLGKSFCLNCGEQVQQQTVHSILHWALNWLPGKKALLIAPLWEAKAKKSATSSLPSWEAWESQLRSQGYLRVLFVLNTNKEEVLQLAELDELTAFPKNLKAFYLVIDRFQFKLKGELEKQEVRARLMDSIEQALKISSELLFLELAKTIQTAQKWSLTFACPRCSKPASQPRPHLFSSNHPLGACPQCNGFGYELNLDEDKVIPDPSRCLKDGAIDPFSKPAYLEWQKELLRFAERHGISIAKRYVQLTQAERQVLWKGSPKDKTFAGITACFETLKRWKYKLHVRVFIRRYQKQSLCTLCQGGRLKAEALAVQLGTKKWPQYMEHSVEDVLAYVQSWSDSLSDQDKHLVFEPLAQIKRRLSLLVEVGLPYLTLGRLSKTLSGGEYQRINLSTQLGNGLCGTLYVLDEPSIGLHPADTARLIAVLADLRNQGNTVLVVEHDLEIMRAADFLIELGPGSGQAGGSLIAQGTAQELMKQNNSLTGAYLSGKKQVKRQQALRPMPPQSKIRLEGCREHNLKNLSIEFPLERLVVVTGVSGSGKSTLVRSTLYNALSQIFKEESNAHPESPRYFDRIDGAQALSGVLLVDQSPIGKSSRSNPATYIKAWDEVRRIYASQILALERGYSPQYFSFNVDGGRCLTCKGDGQITLDMHFMADVSLPCEDCEGKRFKKEILDIRFQGKNIDELLNTSIDEAYPLFEGHSELRARLHLLQRVGLGYLQMGQAAPKLSGGEAQRLKIAACLGEKKKEKLLYIFDEPTTGLHLEDVKRLMNILQELVSLGQSIIIIEHHLDVIAQADWVIDLGPGGGARGGEIVAQGTPRELTTNPKSLTGKALRHSLDC